MEDGLVLAVSSRALLASCANLGLDSKDLLRAAGLTEEDLADPDARLPAAAVAALWRGVQEHSDDPGVAVRAVEALPEGAYKVVDFLGASSRSVGEGMTKVARYFPLINTAVHVRIDEGPDRITICLDNANEIGGVPRFYAEYALAAMYLRSCLAFRRNFALSCVEFAYAQPESIAEHERIFRCNVRFGANATGFSLTRAVWESAVEQSNDGLHRVLEEHAEMLLRALPKNEGIVGRVRAAVHAEMRGGNPAQEEIARRLGLSSRTLHRRLQDEGTSFLEVLDTMRANAARVYLGQPEISISEVAHLLGFAEHSSFTRAFKRWTGSTPGAYRRSH